MLPVRAGCLIFRIEIAHSYTCAYTVMSELRSNNDSFLSPLLLFKFPCSPSSDKETGIILGSAYNPSCDTVAEFVFWKNNGRSVGESCDFKDVGA